MSSSPAQRGELILEERDGVGLATLIGVAVAVGLIVMTLGSAFVAVDPNVEPAASVTVFGP